MIQGYHKSWQPLPFTRKSQSSDHRLSRCNSHFKPKLAVAYVDLGHAYGMSGQLDQAIEEFKNALNLDPNLVEAHYALGVSFRHQGIFPLAIESLQKAVGQRPNFTEAYINLGYAHRDQGTLEDATEAF